MTAVAVRRLRLAAPVEARMGAVQRIEEGLRLAAPAGQRVLLIRRLPLGTLRLSGPPRAWTARIEDTLRAIAAGAVHGLSPGARGAAAVWFHSIEEMLAALLMRIGRRECPDAWFWRAGAPAWDGGGSPTSAATVLGALGGTQAGVVATATTVVALAETGHLDVIAAAVAPILRRRAAPTASATAKPAERASDGARAGRLLERLSPAARAGLEAALHRPTTEAPLSQWLVEAALVAAAPEFAAAPGLLTRTAAAWIAERRASPDQSPDAPVRSERKAAPEPGRLATPRPASDVSVERPRPVHHVTRESAQPSRRPPLRDLGAPERSDIEQRDVAAPASIATAATRERASAVAGVLLLVGPLTRLGFPAWLDARPGLAAEGFGRALLSEIAARHRAPGDDPVRRLARAPPAPLWEDMLNAWRIGLDRWLRRRARIRLSDVASKRGWLTIAETAIDARFAPEAADVRLRRLALDIDPRWVPWLGLTLHYHYRAEPLS